MERPIDLERTQTITYVLYVAAGLTQILADPTTTYLYGATRIGADSTAWTYYHADALGSVRAMSDASGQPISAHGYSPYGDPTTAAPDDFGYTGEQTGAGGLVYLRARYYNPGMGVFLSHDPWSGDVMRPASLNGWSYVEGNPINWTDPSGLCIDTKTGNVRWTEDPYGTSGLCIHRYGGAKSPVQPAPPASQPEHLEWSYYSESDPIPDVTAWPGTTQASTILASTIRIEVDLLGALPPCPTPNTATPQSSTGIVFQSTGTYVGNGTIYTHRHGANSNVPGSPYAAITGLWDSNGSEILASGTNVPLRTAFSITSSGNGHLAINLGPGYELVFQSKGVHPASYLPDQQLAPGSSTVSIPVWTGAFPYTTMSLLTVFDLSASPTYGGEFGHETASVYRMVTRTPGQSSSVIRPGSSGGGIWYNGVVIGNIWHNYFNAAREVSGISGAMMPSGLITP